ncbi:MAG: 16S rRNA (uracil(1498)-N(3))-methyltransferase [Actinomycetaceae bacterium]|nr:16S rRNA (uracil(1498)-N(3))-methyltransferase [Actinomycetaceae bacterium]
MTAPVYVAAAIGEATIVLDGAEAHHAATVRRTRPGERIDIVDGRGTRARCVVAEVAKTAVSATVLEVVREAPPAPRITLVQALAKAGRDLAAVETATEYGAARFVPWQCERAVVTWKGKEAKSRGRWQATALAAAKQSRRAWVPEVTGLKTTAEVIDAALGEGARILVCHEEASAPVPDARDAGELWIVVGPEGGITPGEIEAFEDAGASVCSLSPHVLRSSSAGPFAIAALSGMRLTSG